MEYFIIKSELEAIEFIKEINDSWLPNYLLINPSEIGHTTGYCGYQILDNGDITIMKDEITSKIIKK